MTRQVIDIEGYWKVVVYWDVDYHFFDVVKREMLEIGANEDDVEEILWMMKKNGAKAVTFSVVDKKKSIVVFNPHKRIEDYVNSIVHEAEHVKQAMLKGYDVKDRGEDAAYTIGYLVMKMWKGFRENLETKVCGLYF